MTGLGTSEARWEWERAVLERCSRLARQRGREQETWSSRPR